MEKNYFNLCVEIPADFYFTEFSFIPKDGSLFLRLYSGKFFKDIKLESYFGFDGSSEKILGFLSNYFYGGQNVQKKNEFERKPKTVSALRRRKET